MGCFPTSDLEVFLSFEDPLGSWVSLGHFWVTEQEPQSQKRTSFPHEKKKTTGAMSGLSTTIDRHDSCSLRAQKTRVGPPVVIKDGRDRNDDGGTWGCQEPMEVVRGVEP